MDKSGFLKGGAVFLLLSILFFPEGSKIIPYIVVLGLIMGVWWFTRLD